MLKNECDAERQNGEDGKSANLGRKWQEAARPKGQCDGHYARMGGGLIGAVAVAFAVHCS